MTTTPSSSSSSRPQQQQQGNNNNNNNNVYATINGVADISCATRYYDQVLNESDHTKCTSGNKNERLTETLDQLRSTLLKEIQDDDWKYNTDPTQTDDNVITSAMIAAPRR